MDQKTYGCKSISSSTKNVESPALTRWAAADAARPGMDRAREPTLWLILEAGVGIELGINVPLLGKTVIVDVAVQAQTISSAPVASDSRGIGLRALRLPSTTWSADDKEVVEDGLTFGSTEF